MRTLLVVLIGFLIGFILAKFIQDGFNSFKYDHIAGEQYPTKWYKFQIVRERVVESYDEFGKKFTLFVQRPFKNYELEYATPQASRLNKQFDKIYKMFN